MKSLFLSLFIALIMTPAASADTVKRHILALYNGSDERSIVDTRLHLMLETPFNHLGYILDYRELGTDLPELSELAEYAGVVSWIEADVVVEEGYFRRANEAMDLGVKWIVFGDVGGSSESRAHPDYDGFLRRLGLIDTGDYTTVTYDASYDVINGNYFGFEAQLSSVLPGFPVYVAAGGSEEVLLSANSPRMAQPAVLAAVSPYGGYVASGYAMNFFEDLQRTMWFVDPFRYLERVMERSPWPVPDTTTISGRRIYFSHIDGDGWINASQAVSGLVSAQVIQQQVIEAYPDLPVSVGLVAGDVVYEEDFAPLVELTAREIFALPQVEVASHTMTHPFHWTKLVTYDREGELEDIAAREHAQSETARLDTEQETVLGDPWRFYAENPYSVDEEIGGALAVSTSLAPEGKPARLYLWSGDTSPGQAELAATREAGVLNMNGGDTRLDGEYPSYTYVAPLTRVVGSERQVYSANSNENTYTNLWRGPFYGQYLLEETWRRTGTPLRLRPMNLYYHMYAGERLGSLGALIHHLEIARAAETAPIEASRYASIVGDFFSLSIDQSSSDTWIIRGLDALATVRFDGVSEATVPDYSRSAGVIGHRYEQGSLYLALDTARADVQVTLAEGSKGTMSLRQSRWRLTNAALEHCRFSATVSGYGKPEIELWAPAGEYAFSWSLDGRVLLEGSAKSDGEVLKLEADITTYNPLELLVSCGATTS